MGVTRTYLIGGLPAHLQVFSDCSHMAWAVTDTWHLLELVTLVY